ncbi:serine hydrolase domain-containing protein [Massilia aerilata]|uniref:Serine hydrolase domain-containing protein n=1 Tax=Massilia aerilata TaxID=453817 RepID=A0ABW0RWZ3_9BURK
MPLNRITLTLLLALGAAHALAAPDEEKLGKAQGYPVGNARNWFYDEAVRVGSFSNQGEIEGIFGGKANVLAASSAPMPLPKLDTEPRIRWTADHGRSLSIDDYLARERVMGLLIIKDGVVQVERYQYDRSPAQRFVSNSMAKSIVSMAVGIALQEGKIASLDDRADKYATRMAGTLYGETTIRNLLRMSSGAHFEERYDGKDDLERFGRAVIRGGVEEAAKLITVRDAPQGTRFSYASAETEVLAGVLRGATGMSLSDYLGPRLWQVMGAETSALWRAERTGLERAAGNFNATLRDYGRLGIVLANDGMRPDTKQQLIPRDYLLEATDWRRAPAAFRPRTATPYYGYNYQFWTFPTDKRRFAMLGVYGQMIFVDPELKLVMVQTTANATAKAGETTLGKNADAFWRGVVEHYGSW